MASIVDDDDYDDDNYAVPTNCDSDDDFDFIAAPQSKSARGAASSSVGGGSQQQQDFDDNGTPSGGRGRKKKNKVKQLTITALEHSGGLMHWCAVGSEKVATLFQEIDAQSAVAVYVLESPKKQKGFQGKGIDGIAICWANDRCWYLDLSEALDEGLSLLDDMFATPQKKIVGYGLIEQMAKLRKYDISCAYLELFDIEIAASCLKAPCHKDSFHLESLCAEYLNWKKHAVIPKGLRVEQCCLAALRCWNLKDPIEKAAFNANINHLLPLDMHLIKLIEKMQQTGICVKIDSICDSERIVREKLTCDTQDLMVTSAVQRISGVKRNKDDEDDEDDNDWQNGFEDRQLDPLTMDYGSFIFATHKSTLKTLQFHCIRPLRHLALKLESERIPNQITIARTHPCYTRHRNGRVTSKPRIDQLPPPVSIARSTPTINGPIATNIQLPAMVYIAPKEGEDKHRGFAMATGFLGDYVIVQFPHSDADDVTISSQCLSLSINQVTVARHRVHATSVEEDRICLPSYIIAAPGNVFLRLGINRMFLHVLAQLSEDETLQKAAGDPDPNTVLALQWMEVASPTAVTHVGYVLRAVALGIGADALSKRLKVSVMEAEHFMHTFAIKFPKLKLFVGNSSTPKLRTIRGYPLNGCFKNKKETLQTAVLGSVAEIVNEMAYALDTAGLKIATVLAEDVILEVGETECDKVTPYAMSTVTSVLKRLLPNAVACKQGGGLQWTMARDIHALMNAKIEK